MLRRQNFNDYIERAPRKKNLAKYNGFTIRKVKIATIRRCNGANNSKTTRWCGQLSSANEKTTKEEQRGQVTMSLHLQANEEFGKTLLVISNLSETK